MIKQLDLDSIAKRLTPWLRERSGGDVRAVDLSTPMAGLSNDTVFFELDDGVSKEALVARLAPTEQFVFPDYNISM